MKWQSHKISTIAMVYAVTGTFSSACLAGIGSVLPDVLEFRGLVSHRTITHWPYPYFLVSAALYAMAVFRPRYLPYILFFVLIGAICHLLQDMLSRTGIPLRTPFGARKGFDLYITHTFGEVWIVSVLVGSSLLAMYVRGFLAQAYLMEQGAQMTMFMAGLVAYLKGLL